MMTLTEKRLREIEGRLVAYEDSLNELLIKFKSVADLSAHLVSIEEESQRQAKAIPVVESRIADLNNRFSFKIDGLNKSVVDNANILSGYVATLEDLKKKQLAVESSLVPIRSTVLDLQKELSGLKASLSDIQASIEPIRSNVSSIQRSDALAHEKIEQVKKEVATISVSIVKHNDLFVMNTDDKRRMDEANASKIRAIQSEYSAKIKALSDQLAAMVAPRNYDEEIADMKRDLATILAVTHTTAKSQDESKISDKVSTMEKAIAQIYTLLKKYER